MNGYKGEPDLGGFLSIKPERFIQDEKDKKLFHFIRNIELAKEYLERDGDQEGALNVAAYLFGCLKLALPSLGDDPASSDFLKVLSSALDLCTEKLKAKR